MDALEAAQPYWRTGRGGVSGLTTVERDSLERGLAPQGFGEQVAQSTHATGTMFMRGAHVGASVVIASVLWLAYQLAGHDTFSVGGATALFCGGLVFVFGNLIGRSHLTAAARAIQGINVYVREGTLTAKRAMGTSAASNHGPGSALEYRAVLDGSLELRCTLDARSLWEALQVGRRYRVWATEGSISFIVYAELA